MTTPATPTLQSELNRADPNNLADMLRKVQLGELLEIQEYDTGTITAAAAVTIPGGALLIQSAHVVTSGTAASVGHYHPGNSTSTPLLPPGGANTAVGIASVAADGSTITFPNTVTRVILRYIKKPAVALTTEV
ncbi:MAG: hypothetical protein JWM10_3023 [Myxococcaceae bacterium]|nr:hypothetical protein [Myxococcaceae bacterium]